MFVFSRFNRSVGMPFMPLPKLDCFSGTVGDFGLRRLG